MTGRVIFHPRAPLATALAVLVAAGVGLWVAPGPCWNGPPVAVIGLTSR